MAKLNKNLLLSYGNGNNVPLLPSNSKGKSNLLKTTQKISFKKFKNINGIQITYGVIKKKN